MRALGFIGSSAAFDAIETYATDSRQTVIKALFSAMRYFDSEEFIKRVFSKQTRLSWGTTVSLSRFQFFENLEHLTLWWAPQVTNLNPLKNLKKLRGLDIRRCRNLSDLSPLASILSLETISLEEAELLSDLTHLAGLPNLKSVTITTYNPERLVVPPKIKSKTKLHHVPSFI